MGLRICVIIENDALPTKGIYSLHYHIYLLSRELPAEAPLSKPYGNNLSHWKSLLYTHV